MHEELQEQVTIPIPKGTLLVLFEYLARSHDGWRRTGESLDESSFVLEKPDVGERLALWLLEGAIERTLPEIFWPEYRQLLAEWKQHLESARR